MQHGHSTRFVTLKCSCSLRANASSSSFRDMLPRSTDVLTNTRDTRLQDTVRIGSNPPTHPPTHFSCTQHHPTHTLTPPSTKRTRLPGMTRIACPTQLSPAARSPPPAPSRLRAPQELPHPSSDHLTSRCLQQRLSTTSAAAAAKIRLGGSASCRQRVRCAATATTAELALVTLLCCHHCSALHHLRTLVTRILCSPCGSLDTAPLCRCNRCQATVEVTLRPRVLRYSSSLRCVHLHPIVSSWCLAPQWTRPITILRGQVTLSSQHPRQSCCLASTRTACASMEANATWSWPRAGVQAILTLI
jgi:hypothetical protein